MNINSYVVLYMCIYNYYSIWYEYMYDNFRVMYYENVYLFNFFKLWGIKIIFYIFIKNILLYLFIFFNCKIIIFDIDVIYELY